VTQFLDKKYDNEDLRLGKHVIPSKWFDLERRGLLIDGDKGLHLVMKYEKIKYF
jgi:hypothetical protein